MRIRLNAPILHILAIWLPIVVSCNFPLATHVPPRAESQAAQTSPDKDFISYQEAINWVQRNPAFRHDYVDTARSSFIRGAHFYTDGAGYGYLILNLNGQSYIHDGVPNQIWQEFRIAESFGSYYNAKIKGRYPLWLAKS
jgi:hypothetical protein